MDTIPIKAIADGLAEFLRAEGYEESTVRQYMKGFSYLGAHSPDGLFTEGAAESFLACPRPDGKPCSKSYIGFKRKVVRLAAGFAEAGAFDLAFPRHDPQPQPRSPSLAETLREYRASNEGRGLAAATCDHYGRLAREYLLFAESEGVADASGLTAGLTLSFMSDISGRWAGTSTYHLASNFRPFLKWLGRDDLVDALRLANPRRRHAILPVLGDADGEAVARACLDGSVAAGDAAITLLTLTTGMRACDIVALRLGDVDWRTSTISIVQRKTGNPLTVPMRPALAEALGRYVLEERPGCGSPNVFVRQKEPHAALADHSAVYAATRRVLAAAGVGGGGTRLLRHSAASGMLRAGAPLPTISAVLGHARPDSTGVYLETDAAAMAMCVLPLPEGARA